MNRGRYVDCLMPEAFVLFKTEPTKEREVYLELSGNPSVSEVHVLYGEFDLLIRISSGDAKSLTGMLMKELRQIPGVRETQTMIAVDY